MKLTEVACGLIRDWGLPQALSAAFFLPSFCGMARKGFIVRNAEVLFSIRYRIGETSGNIDFGGAAS